MERFEQLEQELQKFVPFRIRYKDEQWEMQLLNLLVFWFNPSFLTSFTTVIGSTIYFPTRSYVTQRPEDAMRTLAHEVVHLLDMERIGFFPFMVAYGFPQILALGVLSFPWLGWWACLFLIFALPWPAPFRARFEARAYALDLLTCPPTYRLRMKTHVEELFAGWSYYRMYPFKDQVYPMVKAYVDKVENAQEPTLLKVLLVYEMVAES